jgi:hypothetical protein
MLVKSAPLSIGLGALGLLLLLCDAPLAAHHSFAADFDAAKPIALTGTLTRLEWTNPHAHIVMDARAGQGASAQWRVELSTPNVLIRGGWQKNTVRLGDRLTVNGYAAKDGSRFVTARTVMLPDGRTLFTRAFAGASGRVRL